MDWAAETLEAYHSRSRVHTENNHIRLSPKEKNAQCERERRVNERVKGKTYGTRRHNENLFRRSQHMHENWDDESNDERKRRRRWHDDKEKIYTLHVETVNGDVWSVCFVQKRTEKPTEKLSLNECCYLVTRFQISFSGLDQCVVHVEENCRNSFGRLVDNILLVGCFHITSTNTLNNLNANAYVSLLPRLLIFVSIQWIWSEKEGNQKSIEHDWQFSSQMNKFKINLEFLVVFFFKFIFAFTCEESKVLIFSFRFFTRLFRSVIYLRVIECLLKHTNLLIEW